MTPSEFLASKLQSPLGERSVRRMTRLLVFGATAATVAHTGLIPTQIEGLGIQFSTTDQRAFAIILVLIISYLLVVFALSTTVDGQVARLRRKEYLEGEMSGISFEGTTWKDISSRLQEIHNPLEMEEVEITRLGIYTVLIELYLPILVGIYGIGALLILYVT